MCRGRGVCVQCGVIVKESVISGWSSLVNAAVEKNSTKRSCNYKNASMPSLAAVFFACSYKRPHYPPVIATYISYVTCHVHYSPIFTVAL